MSYAIFRTQKMQSTVINKCQRHNQRENKSYSNKDIDLNKTMLNYDLHNKRNIIYRDEINRKINERYKGEKAVRKDAVLNVECLITSDSDFFKRVGSDGTKKYFEESYNFIKNEFGKENILYATVHLDETTPHMHLGFIPITSDGRLSAKDWLDGKRKLTELQNRFHYYITHKGFDLDRGTSSNETKAKNIKIQDLKKRSLEEINKELEKKQKEFEEITNILYQNSLDISQINKIEYEDASTLLRKDTENIKIKKSDFEKLKKSAIKAYEQHNLYATVSSKIETLEKLKDEYKQERDIYYNKYNASKHEHNRDSYYIKQNYEEVIQEKNELIGNLKNFIKTNNLTEEFNNYSQKLKTNKNKKNIKCKSTEI